jgi:hypothetical protein
MADPKSKPDVAAEIAHHVALLKCHDTGSAEFGDRIQRFARLHLALVPASGPAETVRGEVVRAVNRLSREERRNGSANWNGNDYYENLAKFLADALLDTRVFDDDSRNRIAVDIQMLLDHGKGSNCPTIDVVFGRLLEDAVCYCQGLPEPVPLPAHRSK